MTLRSQDELLDTFWKTIPERAGQATMLWMAVEDGEQAKLAELKRLLHTIKGEAHMLGAKACASLMEQSEHVIQRLPPEGSPPRKVGDALLNVFEVMVALASTASSGSEAFDTGPLFERLQMLLRESMVPSELPETPGSAVPPRPPEEPQASAKPGTPDAPALRIAQDRAAAVRTHLSVQDVQPHVHELRRLLGEQSPLTKDLREVHRMLRALLAELDPALSPTQLAERITKTLGYGWEVERRVARIRSQWSQGEFSLRMAVDSLDSEVRTAAMVSVGSMLARLVRIARTTAAELDKQVELTIEGSAFVDDSVAEKLETAFVHLVRNAVDHGIEDPSTRAHRGKPTMGSLAIRVRSADGRVHIAFEDDGGGVDVDALRHKLGDRAASMDDAQVVQTIFEHGTTSRDEVTGISGRGVGLDAVAEALGQIGGHIEVRSEPGRGTTFQLSVPVTMAADMVLPVRAGPFRCAFPSQAVRMVAKDVAFEHTARGEHARVSFGDSEDLIPAYSLAEVLGGRGELRRGMPLVVLEHRGTRRALAIDTFESPRPVGLEPASQLACDCPSVVGAAATPDGGVLLVLDPMAVIDRTKGQTSHATQGEVNTTVAHVLVAEDAPVARELLCGILRSFGLRVTDSPDGRKALAAATEDPPDLLITDLEMPFMGGLELIARLREEAGFRSLPILVLTTRDDAQTRVQAERLDVRGFLSKQKFVEADLRRLIDSCLST